MQLSNSLLHRLERAPLLCIALLAVVSLGDALQASDAALLNRLKGSYNGRFNTSLTSADVGDPLPDPSEGVEFFFTGDLKLPRRRGQSVRGNLILAQGTEYRFTARVTRIRCRKGVAIYLGNIIFTGDPDVALGGPFGGRLRAKATTRGQNREKLSFPADLRSVFEVDDPDPDLLVRITGRFNGVK